MVSLTFQTKPAGAVVFLDSADTLKITPVTFDIAEGIHDYVLRLNRYEDVGGTITVIAGNDYTLEAVMKETSVSMQQQFNNQMMQLGWAGLAVAAVGILITLMRSRKPVA
jgi:hypothetical protein